MILTFWSIKINESIRTARRFRERLIANLMQSRVVKFQLMFCLFAGHVYKDTVKCTLEFNRRILNSYPNAFSTIYLQRSNSSKVRATKKNFFFSAEDIGLIKLPFLIKWYGYLSNIYFFYVLIKTALPIEIWIRDHLLEDKTRPLNCIIPGQFIIYPLEYKMAGLIMALLHVTWRVSHFVFPQNYAINLFMFLVLDDKDIEKSQANLNCNYNLREHDIYLKSVVCYSIYNQRTRTNSYKIRPNRTREALYNIRKAFANAILVTTIVLCFFILIFATILLTYIIFDAGYLFIYPNCSETLEEAKRRDELSILSITLNASLHRILALPLDMLENLFLWLDSGLAGSFLLVLLYLLNYDLIYYLKIIKNKLLAVIYLLEEKRNRMKVHEVAIEHGQEETCRLQLSYENDKTKLEEILTGNYSPSPLVCWFEKPYRQRVYDLNLDDDNYLTMKDHTKPFHLVIEQHLRRLQRETFSELIDFFQLLKGADTLISEVLTAALLIWFTTFAAIAYFSRNILIIPSYILCIQAIGFSILTVIVYFLLILPRELRRTHKLLCSIISLDTSVMKIKYLEILEFYSKDHEITYTLFHSIPLKATTYIAIVGWSVSCITLIQQLILGNPQLNQNFQE